jgi:hypothetical protein
MNAPTITHGLKTVGFGIGMVPGIIVIAVACLWLGNPKNQQRLLDGLFT